MDIRQEVPLHSFSIAAYIASRASGDDDAHGPPEFLLLKRSGSYLKGTWQMVTGMIEKGERADRAALREIKEETGITPDEFYSAGLVESFFLARSNLINMAPVFLAVCHARPAVRLQPEEHAEYRWVDSLTAEGLLAFPQQIENLQRIERMFFQRTPAEFLRIEM